MHPDAQDYPIIWKPIPGFEKWYRISNTGLIYSKRRGKLLKPSLASNGYLTTALYARGDGYRGGGGVRRTAGVHRLVAEVFVPNPNNLPEVDHEDSNRSNNNAWNLQWCTTQQNTQFSIQRGNRKQNGEHNTKARLTKADVLAIRASSLPGIELAKQYGVQPAAISKIRQRRTWRHLP